MDANPGRIFRNHYGVRADVTAPAGNCQQRALDGNLTALPNSGWRVIRSGRQTVTRPTVSIQFGEGVCSI